MTASPISPHGKRRAAFLDRDGVINLDVGYAYRPEQLRFTPTAIAGIRLLNDSGYLVIVVTNQSGVARGLYGTAEVEAFHDYMQGLLQESGAHVDGYYYCPYHPDGVVPGFAIEHDDRKPGPGMLLRAIADWQVATDGSFLIGDKPRDIEAAQRAGVPGLLVETDDCDLEAAVRSMIMPETLAASSETGEGE